MDNTTILRGTIVPLRRLDGTMARPRHHDGWFSHRIGQSIST